jgi:hypothetical protein
MGKTHAFVLAGLCGGLLTYGASRLVDWRDKNEPSPGGADSTELQRLRAQVRQLEGSIASSDRLARAAQLTAQAAQAVVRQRVEALPAPPQGSESGNPGTQDESLPTEAPSPSPPEPSPQEVVEQMDGRFYDEKLDPDWSREALPRAEQFSGRLPEGVRVVSLQCRSSMCRLETSHPNLESFQGFIQQTVMRGEHNWNGPIMAALQGDPKQPGEVKAVVYLAREGTDLSP